MSVLAFDGLDDMVEQMSEMMGKINQVAVYLPPGTAQEITGGLVEATSFLGFDPTSPDAYSAIGLDLSRPAGVVSVPFQRPRLAATVNDPVQLQEYID